MALRSLGYQMERLFILLRWGAHSPDLPNHFEQAYGLVRADIPRQGTVVVLVLVFAALGLGVREGDPEGGLNETETRQRSIKYGRSSRPAYPICYLSGQALATERCRLGVFAT
jgi:hypothetical protein